MSKWKGSAYMRKTAPPNRRWRNRHTGVVGRTPAEVLFPKKKAQVEPTGKNIYGVDSIARQRKRKKLGFGFEYV